MYIKLVRGLEFHFLRQVKSDLVTIVNWHIVWNLNILILNFEWAIFTSAIRECHFNVWIFNVDCVSRFSHCSRCCWGFSYWLSYFCSCCWCFWSSFDCRWCFYWCRCFRRCHSDISSVVGSVDIRHCWLCFSYWRRCFVC